MPLAPPPKPAPAPPVDPRVAHDAAVSELERCLDASMRGALLGAGLGTSGPLAPLESCLPVGDYSVDLRAEVEAHYLAAGWSKATIATADKDHPTWAGLLVLTLTP